MILRVYTIIHTVISLVAILTGLVVLFGLLSSERREGWTKWFLITAVATTVTGFFFPFHGFTPAFNLGIISSFILAITIYACYPKRMAGAWRWIYVVGATISLYLNIFVAIVQSFQKIPTLKTIAPTQSEPPFQIAQLVALVLFVGLGIFAVINFHPDRVRAA